MRRDVMLAGAAALAATVLVVLLVHGTDEDGYGAAIRATARTSALCAALAFARIRVREFSALLPLSQALHYAVIIAAGAAATRDAATIAVGVAVFAVMVWNAIRPNAVAIYTLWIAFLIAFARPGALYVMIIALLLAAAPVRWWSAGVLRRSNT